MRGYCAGTSGRRTLDLTPQKWPDHLPGGRRGHHDQRRTRSQIRADCTKQVSSMNWSATQEPCTRSS